MLAGAAFSSLIIVPQRNLKELLSPLSGGTEDYIKENVINCFE